MRAYISWYGVRISHLTPAAVGLYMSYSVRMCPEGPGLFFDRTCPLKQGCGRLMSVRNKDTWAYKLTNFRWYVAADWHPNVPAVHIAEWQDADLCIGLLYVVYQENAPHYNGRHEIFDALMWHSLYLKEHITEKFVVVTTDFLRVCEVRRGIITWNRIFHKKLTVS